MEIKLSAHQFFELCRLVEGLRGAERSNSNLTVTSISIGESFYEVIYPDEPEPAVFLIKLPD